MGLFGAVSSAAKSLFGGLKHARSLFSAAKKYAGPIEKGIHGLSTVMKGADAVMNSDKFKKGTELLAKLPSAQSHVPNVIDRGMNVLNHANDLANKFSNVANKVIKEPPMMQRPMAIHNTPAPPPQFYRPSPEMYGSGLPTALRLGYNPRPYLPRGLGASAYA